MNGADDSLPPEIASLLAEARRGAPTPTLALQERVLARVVATVASPPTGSGGSSLAGAVAKAGLALLLAVGGYAAFKALGTSAPRPEAPQIAATESEPPPPIVIPMVIAASQPEARVAPPAPSLALARTRQRTPRAMRAEPADPLALEEALLEQARAQVPATPQVALRLLTQHARRFPRGQLAEERELLRARAHLANGDTAAAREVARRFLENYPHSASRREMERI